MSYCHYCNFSVFPPLPEPTIYKHGCGNQWYRTVLHPWSKINFDKLADVCLELGTVGSILMGVEAFPRFHVALANPLIDVTRYLRAANCPVTLYHRIHPQEVYINKKPDREPVPQVGKLYAVWGTVRKLEKFGPLEVEMEGGLKVPRITFDQSAQLVQTRYDLISGGGGQVGFHEGSDDARDSS